MTILDAVSQNIKPNQNRAQSENKHGSFLENLAAADEKNAEIYKELEKEIKQNAQMFKQFDFMRLLNKLQFGNLKDGERAEIFAKMNKIAREI